MRILFVTYYDPSHLGVRALAAYMKREGHEVAICQFKDLRHKRIPLMEDINTTGYVLFDGGSMSASGDTLFPITETEFHLLDKVVKDWKPDIIGLTNRTPYNHLLPQIVSTLRHAAPHAFLVGGGFGPTYEPEIQLSLGVDAIIRGEGEQALHELTEALAAGKDWREIKNISWMKEGQLINNPLRPLLTDLDALPFALNYGEHFFAIEDDTLSNGDMRLQFPQGVSMTGFPILGGRGCIGQCSYCAGGNWRNHYRKQGLSAPPLRQRSLENIFEELLLAKQHNEKGIVFVDEYFVRPTKELIGFFKLYAKEIALPFFAHLHHKQLLESPELLHTVKDAGIVITSFGVQSASEDFARNVYNRRNSNKTLLASLKACYDAGIASNYHIIGNPNMESEAEEDALYDFTAQIPYDPSLKTPVRIHSSVMKLFAGTPLSEKYPQFRDNTFNMKKYARTIMLAELRNKVDAQTFESLRQNPLYAERPDKLHELMHTIINDNHYAYMEKEIARLQGQEVYFWGYNDLYHSKHHLFSGLKPRCILEENSKHPDSQNGLPIVHPDEILPTADVLPIVVFDIDPNRACRIIARNYPQYNDIVSCARYKFDEIRWT